MVTQFWNMMFRNERNHTNHLIQIFHLTIEESHSFQKAGFWAQLSYSISLAFHKAETEAMAKPCVFLKFKVLSSAHRIVNKIQSLEAIGIKSLFFLPASSQGCSQILEPTEPSHNMAASHFKANRRISLTRKDPITLLRNCLIRSDSPRIISFIINSKSSALQNLCHTVEPNHSMIPHHIQRSSNTQEEEMIQECGLLENHLRILPITTPISKVQQPFSAIS